MAEARCPKCGVEVGATWRWCLACGYDPDGSAARVRQAAIERRQHQGGWLPVVIVLAGLVVGGLILWKTTPDDRDAPTVASRATYEVTHWEPFSPDTRGFRVDLPAQPTAQPPTTQVTSAGQIIQDYVTDSGPLHFRVLVVDTSANGAPLRDEPDAPVLDIFASDVATGYQGKLREHATKIEMGTYAANEFTVYDGAQGDLRARAVLVGRYLFAVAVAGEELPEATVRHFLDSFQVD